MLDFLDDPEALELQAAGEELETMISALPIGTAGSILEVGCGSGAFTRALARSAPAGCRVVGVDTSRSAVGEASRLAGVHRLRNLEFTVADILRPRSLDALAGRFDLVVCRYFLMYMTPRGLAGQCLRGMRSCARPAGLVACVEVDANFGQDRYPPPSPRLDEVLRRIVPLYREQGLVDWRCGLTLNTCLREAGLSDVHVRVVDGRVIAGGEPAALVEHGCLNVEELLEPCLAELGRPGELAAMAGEWRAYLRSPASFVYTPVFLGWGRNMSHDAR